MQVPRWTHSKLDTFVSCPRQYEAKYILKSVDDPPGEAQLYGTRVHLAFEEHARDGKPLPEYLRHHQPFMDEIAEGTLIGVERLAALTTTLRPIKIDKWHKPIEPLLPGERVWWSGVIDHDSKLKAGNNRYRCVDYKTGKLHTKMEQLKEYAIFKFCEGADEVEVMYYWTKTAQALPRIIFHRGQFKQLVDGLLPSLSQFSEAHKTGIFQPRQNGLCKRHCPVFDCEFNQRSGPDG